MACYEKVASRVARGGMGVPFSISEYSFVVVNKVNRRAVCDVLLKSWLRACLRWEELPRVEVYDIHYKIGRKLDTFDRWVVWQNPQVDAPPIESGVGPHFGAFPRECGIGWIPVKKHIFTRKTLQTENMGLALQFCPDRTSDDMGEHCRAVRLRLFEERIPARTRHAMLEFMKALFLNGKYDDSIRFTLGQKSKIQYVEANRWRSGKARFETSWRNVGNAPIIAWEHEVFDCLPFAHIGFMQQAYGAYGGKAVYVPDCTPMEYPVY